MSDFKNRKLLVNTQEFDKSGTRYQINGVDLNKAIFFWRKSKEMYDVIPKGDYKIIEEGGSTYLEIVNTSIYPNIERIQVCYEFASLSSTYEVDFNVDITTLKDRYNELVADVKNIFGYVEKNMFTADGLDVSVVLPQLDTGEVWMKSDVGYKGFNVSDIEENIKEFWTEFYRLTQEVIEHITEEGNKQNDRLINTGNENNNMLNNTGNIQADRINGIASGIDNRVQMIWRMYSILTGSQRYLSGGELTSREIEKVEKVVDGGSIADRVGEPKRIYNGGSISNRNISAPITLDLGEYK